jgi:hypothetical protein
MTPDNVDTMHKVCAALGYEPFAMGDKRIMYSKDRERIYEAFGSKDWVRLYVYFKRPGSSVYNVDIEAIAQA